FAAILYQLRHEISKARLYADAVVEVASEHRLVMYKAQARIIRGWTLLDSRTPEEAIAEMQGGFAEYELTHTELLRPQTMTLLAEALAESGKIEEGLRKVEIAIQLTSRSGDASYVPEIYRMMGELLLKRAGVSQSTDDETIMKAEECFEEAIKISQE